MLTIVLTAVMVTVFSAFFIILYCLLRNGKLNTSVIVKLLAMNA